MITKDLEKLASNKEIVGNRIRYHFSKGVKVESPKVSGLFYDIVKEDGQIVLFDGISPFARIIPEKNYSKTTFL